MLGSPIAHSRSPQLHLAAYRALGLHDWTYERIECGAAELPVVVGGFGPEWVGVSVTMPGKFAALRFADERTARADLVGSANTLVRTPHGWRADNTDIDGVAGALGAAAGHALVLGSGDRTGGRGGAGRTRGHRHHRGGAQLGQGGPAGGPGHTGRRGDPVLRVRQRWVGRCGGRRGSAGQHHSSGGGRGYAGTLAAIPVLLDAIYDPWPTPLAAAVGSAGGRVISGLQMLLHQAFAQVEQFTGLPAPAKR